MTHRPQAISRFENMPLIKTPEGCNEKASAGFYFKTFFKTARFAKWFFVYITQKSTKALLNLEEKILDWITLRFPKTKNFRRTLRRDNSFTALEMQIYEKLQRHKQDLRERLGLLKNCLIQDARAMEKGQITEEAHLMRYLQIAAIKLAYSLDGAEEEQSIPLPLPYFPISMLLDEQGKPKPAEQISFDQENYSYSIDLKINHNGLIAYGLKPPNNSWAPPLLLIKGTSKTNLSQILADLNGNIGSGCFKANQQLLKSWLKRHTESKPIVCGHSLGGVIAQIISCKMYAYIAAAVTFSSPSPGRDLIREFADIKSRERQKIKHHEMPNLPEIYHFINEGDLVPYVGGFSHMPGRIFELPVPKDLHFSKKHGYLADITKDIFLKERKIQNRRLLKTALETARLVFSFFLTWVVRIFAKKQTENLTKSIPLRRMSLCAGHPENLSGQPFRKRRASSAF